MLSALMAVLLLAQASASPELEKANALYQAGDWTGAERAYAALLASTPTSPQVRFRLGVALSNLGRHGDAIAHFKEAEKLGTPPMQVALRLALAYAHVGDRDGAFRELTRATGMGLTALPPPLDADQAIAGLRSDDRFKAVEAAIDANARPCEHNPKYRELDFWLGEWEARNVTAPPGTLPASSSITRIHNGCVVLESWRSPGYTGQSFNIYDRSRKQWHQTWVDSTGGLHEYWGNLVDGNMVYEGMIPPLPGQSGPQQTRMTFFNLGPGKVRQLVERTSDGGQRWQVVYDFIYTRKP